MLFHREAIRRENHGRADNILDTAAARAGGKNVDAVVRKLRS